MTAPAFCVFAVYRARAPGRARYRDDIDGDGRCAVGRIGDRGAKPLPLVPWLPGLAGLVIAALAVLTIRRTAARFR